MTARMTSTPSAAARAVSLSRPPSVVLGSMDTRRVHEDDLDVVLGQDAADRVARGVGLTPTVIETLVPTTWLSRVDLPTLGRPMMAANPERVIRRPERLDQHLFDASSVHAHHRETVVLDVEKTSPTSGTPPARSSTSPPTVSQPSLGSARSVLVVDVVDVESTARARARCSIDLLDVVVLEPGRTRR